MSPTDPLALLLHLANKGGRIVSSNDLSPAEIALAKACDRMLVTEGGFGFVWLPPAQATEEPAQPERCYTHVSMNRDGSLTLAELAESGRRMATGLAEVSLTLDIMASDTRAAAAKASDLMRAWVALGEASQGAFGTGQQSKNG